MTYHEMQLKEVQEYAALLFSPQKIARIMGFDEKAFAADLADESTEVSKSYDKGRLITEAELRTSILRLAKQGSSPAQTLAIKLRDELQLDIINFGRHE
jgi:hypothetical protein